MLQKRHEGRYKEKEAFAQGQEQDVCKHELRPFSPPLNNKGSFISVAASVTM